MFIPTDDRTDTFTYLLNLKFPELWVGHQRQPFPPPSFCLSSSCLDLVRDHGEFAYVLQDKTYAQSSGHIFDKCGSSGPCERRRCEPSDQASLRIPFHTRHTETFHRHLEIVKNVLFHVRTCDSQAYLLLETICHIGYMCDRHFSNVSFLCDVLMPSA